MLYQLNLADKTNIRQLGAMYSGKLCIKCEKVQNKQITDTI